MRLKATANSMLRFLIPLIIPDSCTHIGNYSYIQITIPCRNISFLPITDKWKLKERKPFDSVGLRSFVIKDNALLYFLREGGEIKVRLAARAYSAVGLREQHP